MGSLCRNGCGLAYPRCGRGFRAVALCLAKIEPFYGYWLSCSVFSSQMHVLSPGLWVLCAEMGAASTCGRGFRAVALCLAKIGPFYGYWLSCSVFSSQMHVLSPGLWVLCAEMGAASTCGRGFRAVALCLAKIGPFYGYWLSCSVFSCQMQVLSHGLWVLCAEMGVA